MLSEKDSFELKALRARVKELDNEVLRAIDSRNFTTADKLDRMRVKLWKRIDEIEGVKRKHNPARKPAVKRVPAKKSAYVNRPSQATKKPPTKRLKARRAANVRGSGMFPNPAPKSKANAKKFAYVVFEPEKIGRDGRISKNRENIANFKSKEKAVEYARASADATGRTFGVERYAISYEAWRWMA